MSYIKTNKQKKQNHNQERQKHTAYLRYEFRRQQRHKPGVWESEERAKI